MYTCRCILNKFFEISFYVMTGVFIMRHDWYYVFMNSLLGLFYSLNYYNTLKDHK
jgi:hypothetical protein